MRVLLRFGRCKQRDGVRISRTAREHLAVSPCACAIDNAQSFEGWTLENSMQERPLLWGAQRTSSGVVYVAYRCVAVRCLRRCARRQQGTVASYNA